MALESVVVSLVPEMALRPALNTVNQWVPKRALMAKCCIMLLPPGNVGCDDNDDIADEVSSMNSSLHQVCLANDTSTQSDIRILGTAVSRAVVKEDVPPPPLYPPRNDDLEH